MILEIILSWEPENIGWNVTSQSDKYLPDTQDPRIVISSNITVKVYCEKMSPVTCIGKYKPEGGGEYVTLRNTFAFPGDKIFITYLY